MGGARRGDDVCLNQNGGDDNAEALYQKGKGEDGALQGTASSQIRKTKASHNEGNNRDERLEPPIGLIWGLL